MRKYFGEIRAWYDGRDRREKLLVLALGTASIYAIFALILFRPIDAKLMLVSSEIIAAQNQIKNWHIQIEALKKIPQTSLYKEWLNHRNSLQSLHKEYEIYLKETPTKQWSNVIKTILAEHPRIKLIEIKNSPEKIFQSKVSPTISKQLFQQQMVVTVYSNYADTISYLQHLEKALPHIHWDNLQYEVVQYPTAKVQMEFSIVYDKSSS